MNKIDKKTVANKVNEIFSLFLMKNYGDIVLHKEVEDILGFDRTVPKYSKYVKRAKDMLINYSKIPKSIPGVGWQILKPQQVSGYVYRKYIKRTLNMFDYSKDILYNLDKSDFSKDKMQEYTDVKQLNDNLRNSTQHIIKNSKYYSRMDYYNNLNNERREKIK